MRVEDAVAQELADGYPVVLAVSGGVDSMVLMHAAANAPDVRIAAVATYDHGTGVAATHAAARVERAARTLGLTVRRGRARGRLRTESEWRDARLRFLGDVAAEFSAPTIATAHTRDDHLETVVMRVLRGSGARGLAGLLAVGYCSRPLLACRRDEVLAYARAHRLAWSEDPSNGSRAHLRNRVRLDLLPALERARPGFGDEMLELSRRAATLREEIDDIIFMNELIPVDPPFAVPRAFLRDHEAAGLALLWPAIAEFAGVTLDRRGVERLVALTMRGRPGARIPLAGGFEAVIHRDQILLRREHETPAMAKSVRVSRGAARLGPWRLRRGASDSGPLWTAALPAHLQLTLRAWQPGDRMIPAGATGPRRVKGLLRDAGIDAARRAGWPVVLAGDEIVWIPGVRLSDIATRHTGRPMLTFACERDDER